MWSRRSFLRIAGGAAGAAFAVRPAGIPEVMAATVEVAGRTPEDVAADESYWREIQFAFTLDRTLINLNNGNQCPAPAVVHEACKRYMDWSNQAPVYHRGLIEKNIETARRRLGADGALPESTGRVLDVFRAMGAIQDEIGEAAAATSSANEPASSRGAVTRIGSAESRITPTRAPATALLREKEADVLRKPL